MIKVILYTSDIEEIDIIEELDAVEEVEEETFDSTYIEDDVESAGEEESEPAGASSQEEESEPATDFEEDTEVSSEEESAELESESEESSESESEPESQSESESTEAATEEETEKETNSVIYIPAPNTSETVAVESTEYQEAVLAKLDQVIFLSTYIMGFLFFLVVCKLGKLAYRFIRIFI